MTIPAKEGHKKRNTSRQESMDNTYNFRDSGAYNYTIYVQKLHFWYTRISPCVSVLEVSDNKKRFPGFS